MGSLLSIAMLWRIEHAMVIVQTLSGVVLTSECIIWKRRFKMPNVHSMMDLVIRRARLNLVWEGFNYVFIWATPILLIQRLKNVMSEMVCLILKLPL